MSTTSKLNELRAQLTDLPRALPGLHWDLNLFCHFLADRLPAGDDIAAPQLAQSAEELIADLKQGRDSKTGAPFSPAVLQDRHDLMYNFLREQLVWVAGQLVDDEFATGVDGGLVRVEISPPAPPAEAAAAAGSASAAGDSGAGNA